jgi:hypothetical protein
MFYFSDGTTFSSAKQYGPFNISGLGKLSRVRVRGVVTFPLATFGSATQLYNSTVWGIQHVPHGSAANDAISGGDSDAWLDLAEHVPDEINATWAPTSANAFSVTGGPLRLDWAGQLAINANTDFWFSMTSQEPTFTSVAITASLEVLWT